MLPQFVVIGAQKSATSSLCEMLGRHPQVFMCSPKEPFYFSRNEIYRKGQSWYEALFADAEPGQLAGEGTTELTQHGRFPEAPDRMHALLPDAKLVFMARNPLDRVVSHWMHMHAFGGKEQRPFLEAIRADPQYIDHSLYNHQLSFYRERYGEDRLMVLFFEDFVHDTHGETNRVLNFLGIEQPLPDETESSSRGAWSKRRRDTPLLRIMRAIPGLSTLRDGSPKWIREGAVRLFKRPLEGKPEWDEPTKLWAIEQLADDAQAFLANYGKPHDYWGAALSPAGLHKA